jgi:hypothetical protein
MAAAMTDPDIERLLKEALNIPPPREHRLKMLRAAVEREWRSAIAEPRAISVRRRIVRRGLAAAAAVAAVAVMVWVARSPLPTDSLGSMSRHDGGGVAVRAGLFQHRDLKDGEALRVGDRLTTRGAALIALAHGGTLRLAPNSSLTIDSPAQLSLQRGLIYVDIPPENGAVERLRVATIAGAIEHVGTEFEVFSDDRTVRVRVREGSVRFLGNTDTIVAIAGTELLAAPGETIARRSIDTYGGEWLWTAALAPDYDIEGKSLIGFLNWVSRELGRPVDFADANARQVADRTILHGSVRGQPPLRAMSNVLLTASLTYDIRGDTIWVRTSR